MAIAKIKIDANNISAVREKLDGLVRENARLQSELMVKNDTIKKLREQKIIPIGAGKVILQKAHDRNDPEDVTRLILFMRGEGQVGGFHNDPGEGNSIDLYDDDILAVLSIDDPDGVWALYEDLAFVVGSVQRGRNKYVEK